MDVSRTWADDELCCAALVGLRPLRLLTKVETLRAVGVDEFFIIPERLSLGHSINSSKRIGWSVMERPQRFRIFFILPSSRLAGRGGISGRGSSAYKYIYKCIGLEHTARYKAFKRAAYWWGVFSLTGRVGEPNHLLSSGCLFWSAVSAVGSYHSPRVHSLASHRQTNHQPRKNRGPP